MNNNEMKFDPITGQPLNNNLDLNNNISTQDISTNQNVVQTNQQVIHNAQIQQSNMVNQDLNNQIQMQSIPTVDQSRQEFINNTQALNAEKKEEKKSGINYAFIIILFAIIFAAIFFLFPYLLKHI